MRLLRCTIDDDIKLINLELIKEISFKRRKELVDNEYIYFYELLLDGIPSMKFYNSVFKDELDEIKNYTDKSYSIFLNDICDLAKQWFTTYVGIIPAIKKMGWSKFKEFFNQLTFSDDLIDIDLLCMAFQATLVSNLENYFWALFAIKTIFKL